MKKAKNILAIACGALLLASCSVTVPYAITDQPVGSQTGVSKTGVVFGAIQTNKDFGVADAAKQGGITGPVSTVDKKYNYGVIPFLFYTQELIITGEK